MEQEEQGPILSDPRRREVVAEGGANRNFSPGDILASRFRIVRFIAAGGMGEVYEAFDSYLRENVAIKTILQTTNAKSRAISDLRREVQLARRVTHRNVCRVFDIFQSALTEGHKAETLFVSMELLHGKTLAQQLQESGPFEMQEVATLIRQLASGLSAAHEVGVIHGDLKPGNVFLVAANRPSDSCRAVVTDFGLARPAADIVTFSLATVSALTMDGAMHGTPAYMAPEQLQGKSPTIASDVYAFGLVVYEMITGIRPFPDSNFSALISMILTTQPPAPSRLRPNIPAGVDAVVLKALEKGPANRYKTALEFVADFDKQVGEAVPRSAGRVATIREKPYLALTVVLLICLGIPVGRAFYRTTTVGRSVQNSVVEHADLEYFIIAQKYEGRSPVGEPYRVSDQDAFSAGMGIHFIFKSSQDGHLYILNEGPTSTATSPVLNILFPSPSTNDGSSQLAAGKDMTVPDGAPLLFDNRKGTEKLWLVWSKQRISDLEALKKWANLQDRGRVGDPSQCRKIKTFLSQASASSPTVGRDSMQTNLAANSDVLIYPINLNHM